jgi:hypothetical protein
MKEIVILFLQNDSTFTSLISSGILIVSLWIFKLMKLKKLITDIRFWLSLHFLIRMIGITNPPFESTAWRQVITAMVTKNFVFGEFNLFYPKMDYFFISMESTSGISPMEFPIFNALGAILSLSFGWHDWHLRLINLIVSTFGIYYFYKLIKYFFEEQTAFYSAFLLITSIWWPYSRKIMPDTFSISLCIIALYYAFRFFYERDIKKQLIHFLLFLTFGTFGMLAKIPSSYIFCLLLFPLINKTILTKKKFAFLIGSIPSLAFVFWWYFIWSPYLVEKYNNRMFFMGKGLREGFFEIVPHIWGFFEHFYKFAFSYTGFAICILSLYFILKHKDKMKIYIILLLSFSFGVFILKSGYNFVHHSYYIIPFVPVLAFLAGTGLAQIPRKQVVLFIIAIFAIDNILRHQHDLRIPKRDRYRLSVSNFIDDHIPPNELIAVNGGASPVDMYNLGRRGYSLTDQELTDENLDILKKRGIRFFVINKHGTDKRLNQKTVSQNEDLIIYSLN